MEETIQWEILVSLSTIELVCIYGSCCIVLIPLE